MFIKYAINQNEETATLPKPDNILLDGIPESALDFIKVHQPKRGKLDLDNMLYIYVKQVVCNHTSYVLYTQVNGNCKDISNLSVTHGWPYTRK